MSTDLRAPILLAAKVRTLAHRCSEIAADLEYFGGFDERAQDRARLTRAFGEQAAEWAALMRKDALRTHPLRRRWKGVRR